MAESSLAQILNGKSYDDPRRDQSFSFSREQDQFFVSTIDAGREVKFPVTWLLGSGTHARTPVSIDPGSGLGVEFRWTWFANLEALGVTPDHERFDDYQPGTLDCFGRPLGKTQVRACVTCHMTAVPPEEIPASREHFLANVGCERCHGPRKKHVELAHQGRAEESPPLFTYDDPEEYMDRCAQCHRDETNIPSDTAPHELARFQPYGLKRSRCFQESSMTCSTCHDPHDRVSTDRAQYRRICLSCHSSSEQTACPIEPAGKCIECHMPAVEWSSGIEFHDHEIRVP
ncbi:MAG: heme-binding protein [Planctomycetaceae bacterium]|nr:heme-binding protein [Planctomycetaceae bacterium]